MAMKDNTATLTQEQVRRLAEAASSADLERWRIKPRPGPDGKLYYHVEDLLRTTEEAQEVRFPRR